MIYKNGINVFRALMPGSNQNQDRDLHRFRANTRSCPFSLSRIKKPDKKMLV